MFVKMAGFIADSLVNGPNNRAVVFFSGCKHKCPGCQNKEAQDFNYGDLVTVDDVIDQIKNSMPLIKGVTISGGDPFEQPDALLEMISKINKLKLNIWVYTGYKINELIDKDNEIINTILHNIDVLVDGKFIESMTENTPRYMGSSNQRVIMMKKYIEHFWRNEYER